MAYALRDKLSSEQNHHEVLIESILMRLGQVEKKHQVQEDRMSILQNLIYEKLPSFERKITQIQ